MYPKRSRLHKGSQDVTQYSGISTFAEHSVVAEVAAIPIPSDVGLDKAALVGCGVTTGVGAAINTVSVGAGESVAVFGAGGVGLNVIQGAAISGAEPLIAIDVKDNKLEYAKKMGATHVVNASSDDPIKSIKELTNGRGVDYAFEAIGNTKVMVQVLESIRKGGKAVIVGQAPYDDILSFPARMLWEEGQLIGSYYGSSRMSIDMPHIIEMYRSGKLKLDELVTRSYPLEKINEAFDALENGEVARSVIQYS